MTRFITIKLEIPDGIEARVAGGARDDPAAEPLPAPWWSPDEDESLPRVQTIAVGRNGAGTGSCPVHHEPWKTVPAGVSKRSGRPYAEFRACPEPGCDERPPVTRRSAS
jgi:hypothetical protein